MFKILIGIVLGILASYYAAAHLHLLDGPMSNVDIGRSGLSDQVLSSNTINATPPNTFLREASSANIWDRINVAIRLARLSPPDATTPKEVLEVLSIVAQRNSDIRTLMAGKTSENLTNNEAVALLSLIQRRI
jgi:hypothetical protein